MLQKISCSCTSIDDVPSRTEQLSLVIKTMQRLLPLTRHACAGIVQWSLKG